MTLTYQDLNKRIDERLDSRTLEESRHLRKNPHLRPIDENICDNLAYLRQTREKRLNIQPSIKSDSVYKILENILYIAKSELDLKDKDDFHIEGDELRMEKIEKLMRCLDNRRFSDINTYGKKDPAPQDIYNSLLDIDTLEKQKQFLELQGCSLGSPSLYVSEEILDKLPQKRYKL